MYLRFLVRWGFRDDREEEGCPRLINQEQGYYFLSSNLLMELGDCGSRVRSFPSLTEALEWSVWLT